MSAFDWYQGTIEDAAPIWLQSALQERTPNPSWSECPPLKGYAFGHVLYSEGEELLKVYGGGRAGQGSHFLADGAPADRAARLIRSVSPRHLVSRGDVCEDIDLDGWFDQTHAVMLDVADELRVKVSCGGDWHLDPSRTAYMGAPSSAVRIRLYEKGAEVASKYPQLAGEVSRSWVRMEVQVRPSKRAAKLQMSQVEPADWWGCSKFSQVMAERVLTVEAPRVKVGTIYRAHSVEKAEYHMLMQYRRIFEAMHERLGSWEEVGKYIGAKLDEPLYDLDEINGHVADLERRIAEAGQHSSMN